MRSPSPRYRDALRAALERNAALERELSEVRAELANQRERANARLSEPLDPARAPPGEEGSRSVEETRRDGSRTSTTTGTRASLWLPLLVVVGLCVQMVVSFVRPHPGPHARPSKASVVPRSP
jgi:hypothetical protein